MEALISALGIIVSALMDIPSRTTSITDSKKAQLAKTLTKLVHALDIVIARGFTILLKLESLSKAKKEKDFADTIKEISVLIRDQTRNLNTIGETIQKNFLWSNKFLNSFEFLYQPTKIQRVLSIYEPDLGSTLVHVVEWKTNLLLSLAGCFGNTIENIDKENLVVWEIVFIDEDLLRSQRAKHRFQADLAQSVEIGKIKLKDINLGEPLQRKTYLSRAKKRLRELETAREKLAKLIQKYYEPHHII